MNDLFGIKLIFLRSKSYIASFWICMDATFLGIIIIIRRMHSLFYFSRILPLWNSKEIIRIKLLQARQTTLYSTNGQIKVSKSLVNWPLYWIKSKTFSFSCNLISPIRLHFPPLSEANISNLSQTVKNVLNFKKN